MLFRARLVIGVIAVFVAASSVAQVTQVDYSKRAEGFENELYETSIESPEASSRWMAKKFRTTRYSTPEHRYADDRFETGMMERFQSKRFKTEQLEFEKRDVVMFRGHDEMFGSNALDQIRYNTLHHDAKRESRVADVEEAIDIEEFLDRLSLADLNRYQFRRSHSREPGLPVQRAAGATAVE